ncbi:MAG: SRPBCC family protein [Bacteroidales bacterium]|nr:SRPBCC family protein [Bacteroidales bacterium]
MTTIQIILVVIGSIITLFFLVAFFLPSSKTLYRNILINRPPDAIYKLVTDFSYYKRWNPWSAQEPDAEGNMSGEPGKPGHKWSWNGKIIGSGHLEIKELEENKRIVSDLIFTSPRKMSSEDIWKFEPVNENSTRVSWGHHAILDYPVGRYFGLMLEKMLGPEFEQGLENLKKLSESSEGDE